MNGHVLTDMQRSRLIAERAARQAQAETIADQLRTTRIFAEIEDNLARLRSRWERQPVDLCDLERLDVDARTVTALRERRALHPPRPPVDSAEETR
jgi:hypothetical protein